MSFSSSFSSSALDNVSWDTWYIHEQITEGNPQPDAGTPPRMQKPRSRRQCPHAQGFRVSAHTSCARCTEWHSVPGCSPTVYEWFTGAHVARKAYYPRSSMRSRFLERLSFSICVCCRGSATSIYDAAAFFSSFNLYRKEMKTKYKKKQ